MDAVTPTSSDTTGTGAAGWRTRLDAVLAEGGVRLVAQPIVNLATAEIAGYELLSRFPGPHRPDEWFAAARAHGRGAQLGALVLRQALSLRATVPANRFVTVNVEPDELTAPDVTDALLGGGAGHLGGVVIELTEHEPTSMDDDTRAVLEALRGAGALIAVDDAGTGYAGLSHLLDLRPDLVKIDRELVDGIDTDPARRRLLELLGDLCGRIDAWLLAEGVETAAQHDVLVELGVPLVQGWHYGRPAEPWPELDGATREALRVASSRSRLVESIAPLVRDGDALGTWLQLDGAGRPCAVHWSLAGHALTSPALRMSAATGLAEALNRAVSRPPQDRWAPIVVTDGRGRAVGRVDVADLASRVASSPPDAGPMECP